MQREGSLYIPFPRPHNMWELSALGTPFKFCSVIFLFLCDNKFYWWNFQLILELGSYIEELKKTQGSIAEFVNPKYVPLSL